MPGVVSELQPRFGPRGHGKVRFNKEEAKVIAENGDIWEFVYDNVGPFVVQKNQSDCCYMISYDEETLDGIGPWDETLICEFVGFTHEREESDEGEEIEGEPRIYTAKGGPRTQQLESGKTRKWVAPDRDKFTALYEVKSTGPWEGYVIGYWIDYMFTRHTDGSAKMFTRHPSWLKRAENWMDVNGWDRQTMTIPFSDNVLIHMEPLLLELAKKNRIQLIIEEGWVSKITRPATGVV